MNVREPEMMSFMSTSLGCWVYKTKKAVLFRGLFLRAVCYSDTQGWLGFPWPLPRGWAKTCATLPWPLSGWSLQFVFFLLTRRSPRGGSGCQGCAAERSTTGATEERKEPGLDAGASAAYLASPSSRKNRSDQPQARGAAPERRPPARPPWPWEAFHSVPIRGTQPGQCKTA